MKNCELCRSPARAYCESDQAFLCWDCDAKVHGANFLVARHSRSLLCNECKSPTPWKAAGSRLGRSVSVCERCASGVSDRCEEEESEGANDDDLDTDAGNDEEEEDADEYEDSEGEEERNQDEAEEEGENQVVPWSSTPPPPAASSSGSEDDFSETVNVYWRKRMRENCADLHSPDDGDRSSSHRNNRSKSTGDAAAEGGGEDSFADSLRSLKSRKTEPERRPERDGLSMTMMLR